MANMNELSLKTLTPENNFASVAELCLSLTCALFLLTCVSSRIQYIFQAFSCVIYIYQHELVEMF